MDYPIEVCDFLEQLHEDVVCHIGEEFLVVDGDIRELAEKLVWDGVVVRSVNLFGSFDLGYDLLVGLGGLGGHATSHVLGLVHLAELLMVGGQDNTI